MIRLSRPVALAFLVAAVPTGGLVAQVAGLPVRNAGVGTGLGIAGDVGLPNAALGKGVAFGATGAVGLGPIGFTASAASWNPKGAGKSITSVGATGNLKIIGGPLIPLSVTLQAGAARYEENANTIEGDAFASKHWHFPLGVGLALTIPNPVFSIKPWVAPRLDVHRVTGSDGGTATQVTRTDTKFGVSGGVDFGFLSGLTVRAMYDRVSRGSGITESVISFGLGFKVGT